MDNKKKKNTKNTKTNTKTNTKKFKKRKITRKKGGGFFNNIGKSIIQLPKTKNYNVSVPGTGMIKSLSSLSSSLSGESSINNTFNIIFGYPSPNQYDITKLTGTKLIPSNIFIKAPLIRFNLFGKYLLVLYREVNKSNIPTPTLLLHYLVGYYNKKPKEIFYFKDTKIKSGRLQNFVIKLYKYPPDDKAETFIKIENYKKKLAYNELNTYIINNKLIPDNVHTYKFQVTGV